MQCCHSILNVCVVVFFVSLRLHYHLIDSQLWVSCLCEQNYVRLKTIIKQHKPHHKFVSKLVLCLLMGGCVYFRRQQQTFSLRRGELNQQGAVAVVAYTHTHTHIHTQSYTEGMKASCCSGRCDTAFSIGMLSSSLSCHLCLNMCVSLRLVL